MYCSYYSGENSATVESTTHTRRQIHVPSSTLLSPSIAGADQQPSPVNSSYLISTHAEHTDRPTLATVPPELIVAYDDKPSTWPRKQRPGRHHYQLPVDDDNDPARLQQEIHNDHERLGRQHDCKSAETVFTSDAQNYDAASSSAAAAAAEILGGASVTAPHTAANVFPSYANQYSINPPPTTSSPSIPHPFNTAIHPTPGASPYSYPGYLPPSPYNDVQGQRSRTVEDGRHAVDLLFDNLYGSSPASPYEGSTSMAASVRTFPESPYVPAHSPHVKETLYYLSEDPRSHSHAADPNHSPHVKELYYVSDDPPSHSHAADPNHSPHVKELYNYLSDEPRSQSHATDLSTTDHHGSTSAVSVHSYYR